MLKSLYLIIKMSFKTKIQLLLEVAMLAEQLEIYQRTDPKLKINRTDLFFFSLMKDLLSNWKERIFIVKPENVIKWHQSAFKLYWRWKSRVNYGRPKASREVINLVKQMANDNPSWVIHTEKLGESMRINLICFNFSICDGFDILGVSKDQRNV
jgi:putative transposase